MAHANTAGWRLDAQQLGAMLWKHALQKRRGLAQTLLEVLSPVLIMCVSVQTCVGVRALVWQHLAPL